MDAGTHVTNPNAPLATEINFPQVGVLQNYVQYLHHCYIESQAEDHLLNLHIKGLLQDAILLSR